MSSTDSNSSICDMDATENQLSKLSCEEELDFKDDEFIMSGIEKLSDHEKSLKLDDLEQVQRRQSLVFENAQEKVTALENLLKTVDPGWNKQKLAKPVATVAQQCPPAPQAYRFKDIYELKKQQLLRQHLEQERSQRQFHSRPMPNFRQVHQQQANRQVIHRITHPVTPNVLKTSRDMLLKRTQKVEQMRQQREEEQKQELLLRPKTKPVPKFPLKPLNGQSPISASQSTPQSQPKPFRLSTEIRAEQRKRFNAQSQQTQERRRRELEEQRRRQEHLEVQKQRQLATFRARPNPFRPQI